MTLRAAWLLALISLPAVAQTLPIPPIPPLHPPASDLAPVPDRDIRPPVSAPEGVRLRPEVFSAARPETSLAFSPGSRYQASDERAPLQTPGLRMTVPLR